MRKIAATYIFPNSGPPIKNGIVICDYDGTIIDIIKREGSFTEEAGVEFYSGILVPGFVNTHCHLELSHLQNKIEAQKGIGDFLGKINQLRNIEANREKAMQIADRRMWAAGIAAVGDISNSEASLPVKQKSKVFYHTFVEVFGFHPSRAEKAFNQAKTVLESFVKKGLTASIVPHSPYSVSQDLFQKINKNALTKGGIISIHNQESKAESDFFLTGEGEIEEHFRKNLNIDNSHWKTTGKSSLLSVLHFLPKKNKLLLVHNTFTSNTDIEVLTHERDSATNFFVLCPNSNLYIQNQLPPVDLFRAKKLNICVGTDSLASNKELSVLQELITIQQHFSEVTLEELIIWSSMNGAKALGIEHSYGSFDPAKKPGVNLITGIDFKTMQLTAKSKVKRLL